MNPLPTWAEALGAVLFSAALCGAAQMLLLDQASASRKSPA